MVQKLANQDYRDGFTTDLSRTQEKILKQVRQLQPVNIKILVLRAGSYAESTIRENVDKLKDKDILQENSHGALTVTSKGGQL